ncbi:MAG: DUF2336 domain-containing protein [Alphaproteobacteria bacterium]|nr:DUF2336 domain-containing protein [Alphaproteobacteria bacterium]
MGTPTTETVPTLEELQAWARDPSRRKWRNLISVLTDLFIESIEADTGAHGDAYAEVICRMLDDVATEVRKELSERVAPMERFPGRVVRRLANDEAPDVATPMLEHSPVLTESDLIGVIEMMLPAHTRAISRRKELNEKLTDALIRRGDVEAVRTMTANPGAKFSPKTYRIVAERAKSDVDLQESLISRDDLTHVISLQITPFLSEELKARLRALDAPPEGGSLLDSLTEIASESERKSKARRERAAVYSTIEQVLSGAANASEETIKLAEIGDFNTVVHFLAGIAQLPDQTISASMNNSNGTPLAVTLRGLGLTREAAAAIGKVRQHHLNLTARQTAIWLEGYNGINAREAERSLVMLRAKEGEPTQEPAGKPSPARSARRR